MCQWNEPFYQIFYLSINAEIKICYMRTFSSRNLEPDKLIHFSVRNCAWRAGRCQWPQPPLLCLHLGTPSPLHVYRESLKGGPQVV